ncbi:AbrB family transcriptional regulator [Lacisediminimonas profundi]|uniref:AbrB family transcriptional regulator n=1 Tax=Lacisediminimonas profundi TaxID=2603856 RepID=UPI00124B0C4F|nr:AbrB family transcriptional regulator [Lacisediminimonas profundi]
MHFSYGPLRGFLFSLSLGLAAAFLCTSLNTPLPWMIGPLFATAAARMAGWELSCPYPAQCAGQWAIGTALGLYFTPAVLLVVASCAGYIAAGALFAMILTLLSAVLLQRMCDIDRPTAFFSMAIGGASEMALQGEREGAAGEKVAAAHSLRILLVVATIPFAFKFAGVHGSDPYVAGVSLVDAPGLLALVLLTCAGALLLARFRWPNVWFIGPLLVTMLLTGCGINLSAMPSWMISLGQLFIGIALGTRFSPAFIRTAPRFLLSVTLCSLVAILVAAGFGMLVSWAGPIPAATAILATAPGGIAEMSLTAKTLQLGVPVVTAFHVMRLCILVLTVGPLYRLLESRRPSGAAAGAVDRTS